LALASKENALRSEIGRLEACNDALAEIAADVVDLTAHLARLQEAADRLERLLAERDAALVATERQVSRLTDMHAVARQDADRCAAAFHEVTARAGEHAERVAALEQELDGLRADIADRDDRLARAENELFRRAASRSRPPDPDDARGHVRFLSLPEGYRLAVSDEPSPRPGEWIEVDGVAFEVGRIGRSPFPGDDRPCVFLSRG
jgi:chromosome segregation ATPase